MGVGAEQQEIESPEVAAQLPIIFGLTALRLDDFTEGVSEALLPGTVLDWLSWTRGATAVKPGVARFGSAL